MTGVERVLCPRTVGRERELELLAAALERARAGAGGAVALTGDAGVGKTRLAADLGRLAEEAGLTVLWGSCSESELSLPYLPFLEAIGNQLGRADLARLRGRLGAGHRELARLFPQLELEPPAEDPRDPVQGKLRLFEAVLSVLGLLAEGGALLVLENVHRADAASRELLEYLVRRLRGSPILVLATCRLEGLERRHPLAVMVQGWRRGRTAEVIDLAPLGVDGVVEMVRAIFAVEVVAPEVRSLLFERTEGNPYALEELLKDALDRGAISRDQAAWQPGRLSGLRLPHGVRESVLDRLEGLPEAAADVLRCASVLGRSFDYPILVAISGRAPAVVQAALKECFAKQLVEEEAAAPANFRFRHSLTRQAVYEDLLAPQREALHAAAADALAASPGTPPVELCGHLLAARREREAVPLALSAADEALRAHAYREAVRLYERALPIVAEPVRRADLLCRVGMALLLEGDVARAERHLREGARLLESLGAGRAAAGYRLWLGRCYWERSRPDAAAAEYEAARKSLEPEGPSEELALAYVRLAGLAAFELDGERAMATARRAVEIAAEAGAEAPRIWAYDYLGLGLVQLGRVEEGLDHLDRSFREAAAAGLNVIAANALLNGILVRVQHFRPLEALDRLETLRGLQAGAMGRLQALRAEGQIHLWGLGRPGRAHEAFQEALTLAREGEAWQYVRWLEVQLAIAGSQLDRPEAALRLLPARTSGEVQDRALIAAAEMRVGLDSDRLPLAVTGAEEVLANRGWPLRVRLYLSDFAVETLLAAGRPEEARALLEAVLAAGAPADHPHVRDMRGRLLLAAGRPAEAAAELRPAAAAWQAAGMGQYEARSRLLLAAALEGAGEVEAARSELRAVARGAGERGAALDARLAREALARLGARAVTPEHVKEALEALHRPELGRVALVRLLGLADAGAPGLHRLLCAEIERLADSAAGREREAGRLLLDYYLRRVGSQEVVAERLHLTRATFYRRLHLGWALLGARLTATAGRPGGDPSGAPLRIPAAGT